MAKLKHIFPNWVQVEEIQKTIEGFEWQVELDGVEGSYNVLDFQPSDETKPLSVGDMVIVAETPKKSTIKGVKYAFVHAENIIAIV